MIRSEYAANVALSTKCEANEWTRVLGPSKARAQGELKVRTQKLGVLVRVIRAVLGW